MENIHGNLYSALVQVAVNITLYHGHFSADIPRKFDDGSTNEPLNKFAFMPVAVMPTFAAPVTYRTFTRRIRVVPTKKPKFIRCADLAYTPIFVIWLLVVVIVVGNLLAITAFIRNEKIRSKIANHFIFNLSVADLLVGLISVPVNNLHLHFGNWPFGEVGCKLWLILDYTICFQGMTAVVFISMDRYCWVKWPLKYMRLMTRRRAIATITIAWCAGFAYYIIHVLCWEHFEGFAKVDYMLHCDLEIIGGLTHAIMAVVIEFFWPLTTVVVVNGIVYHIVRTKFGGKSNLRRVHSSVKLNNHKNKSDSPIPCVSLNNQMNQSATLSTSSGDQIDQSPNASLDDQINHQSESVCASFGDNQSASVNTISDSRITIEINQSVNANSESSNNQYSNNCENQIRIEINQSATVNTRSDNLISQVTPIIIVEDLSPKKPVFNTARFPQAPSVLALQTLPRHWKTAATLSLMVATLIGLWLPYQAILLWAAVCTNNDKDCVTCLMWESVNYLLWSTAAINPFIYAYTNNHYKKEMLKIFCICCKRKCASRTSSDLK